MEKKQAIVKLFTREQLPELYRVLSLYSFFQILHFVVFLFAFLSSVFFIHFSFFCDMDDICKA